MSTGSGRVSVRAIDLFQKPRASRARWEPRNIQGVHVYPGYLVREPVVIPFALGNELGAVKMGFHNCVIIGELLYSKGD